MHYPSPLLTETKGKPPVALSAAFMEYLIGQKTNKDQICQHMPLTGSPCGPFLKSSLLYEWKLSA